MKKTIMLAIAFAAHAPAFAQPADDSAAIDRAFTAMDADKDGQVSRSEFGQFMRARHARQAEGIEAAFAELDKNRDGKLSKAEVASVPPIASAFEALDADQDGSLSKTEMLAALAKAQSAQTEVD